MEKKRIPTGIDDYKELIEKNFYFVDKTLLIKEILDFQEKVNLFTRPRRFGKTLNMSMLLYYFEDTKDPKINEGNKNLFQETKIMSSGDVYRKYMCSHPVIYITLKAGKKIVWEESYYALKEVISVEFKRHYKIMELLQSEDDRKKFKRISEMEGSKEEYNTSIQFLSRCLFETYEKKCIILIDEYDVPLESAYFSGYYEEMTNFIRSLFESAMKTNPYLEFAVITGCLRIAKESIFTGLINLSIYSIMNTQYSEYFGFTEKEVKQALQYYGHEMWFQETKDWYDGYRFGEVEVYNPWSIIQFIRTLMTEPVPLAKSYWGNTSSNSIIRQLVEAAGEEEIEKIETLMYGGSIEVKLREETTYADIHITQENLWNFLLFTGYLKVQEKYQNPDDVSIYMKLKIPNKEILYIYQTTISTWFLQRIKAEDYSYLYQAALEEDTEKMSDEFSQLLIKTISYFDATAEGFYHGFLTGIFSSMSGYSLKSNRETGFGRPDIILIPKRYRQKAIIIEIKCAKKISDINRKMQEAVDQIKEQKYKEGLYEEGYENLVCYAFVFYKKECIIQKL